MNLHIDKKITAIVIVSFLVGGLLGGIVGVGLGMHEGNRGGRGYSRGGMMTGRGFPGNNGQVQGNFPRMMQRSASTTPTNAVAPIAQ